jgi:hypothetical protein
MVQSGNKVPLHWYVGYLDFGPALGDRNKHVSLGRTGASMLSTFNGLMAALDRNGSATRCGKAPLGCIADRGCSAACMLTAWSQPLDRQDNRRGQSPRQRFVYSPDNWPTAACTPVTAHHGPVTACPEALSPRPDQSGVPAGHTIRLTSLFRTIASASLL